MISRLDNTKMMGDGLRIPVHTITGFLGSGKTTLLNRLVRDPGLADTAVIVNEFGEIGIDHALVETALEEAMLMRSGCLCCTLRGDLVDTLCELEAGVREGRLPSFGRVLVETTGLADPGPVLQTLMGDELLAHRYRAGVVVTTVDAINAPANHVENPEFARQVAVADRLVLTKTDIASGAERGRSLELIRRINAGALLFEAVSGQVEPGALLDPKDMQGDARTAGIERWFAVGSGDGPDHENHGRHRDDVRAYCLVHDRPLPWYRLGQWLESVVSLRGDQLLRIKGLVNVEGESVPVAVHGVRHVLHPPVRLECWPDDDHRTRIVFIARGLELRGVERLIGTAVRETP